MISRRALAASLALRAQAPGVFNVIEMIYCLSCLAHLMGPCATNSLWAGSGAVPYSDRAMRTASAPAIAEVGREGEKF